MVFMNYEKPLAVKELCELSLEARRKIIKYSHSANLPHLGSCLSLVDILITLYFSSARVQENYPLAPDRDRIVLSKGHGAPALFQILAMRGFFPEDWMFRENHGGGLFGEHPPLPKYLPGIEAATGSLGHGLPMAVGMALSAKIRNEDFHTFAICGDGECNEGSVWEALQFVGAQRLDNLTVVVDRNAWQATGRTKNILGKYCLEKKFQAFGFSPHTIDGHDIPSLQQCFSIAKSAKQPVVVIADTIKGKGVSFMEDDNNWHYRVPNSAELKAALAELAC
mgnify:CR=1 FL=1